MPSHSAYIYIRYKSVVPKGPQSPTAARSTSRKNSFASSIHSLAECPTTPIVRGRRSLVDVDSGELSEEGTFGLAGLAGVSASAILFLLDLASDAFLAFGVANQVLNENNYYKKKEDRKWLLATLIIIILPTLSINLLSLIWYGQNKATLSHQRLFQTKTRTQKFLCVFCHIFLLGQIIRYLDTLRHWKRWTKRRHLERLRRGDSNATPSRGSLSTTERTTRDSNVFLKVQVLSRDTATIDLMLSFFKNVPNIVLQLFVIYRTDGRLLRDQNYTLTFAAQLSKVIIGLVVASWHLVSFQDELRRSFAQKRRLECGTIIICFIWRAAELCSRILSIASFSALKVDGEGGIVKVYSNNIPNGFIISFPIITAFVILGHWLLLLIWIHAQKTQFCSTSEGPRASLEFVNNAFLSWVCVFGYLNLKETPTRGRMVFFYALTFVENTAFMVIWYLQLITKEVWLRVTVVFCVEALFLIGVSCAIGYFAFLQPTKECRPPTHPVTLSQR